MRSLAGPQDVDECGQGTCLDSWSIEPRASESIGLLTPRARGVSRGRRGTCSAAALGAPSISPARGSACDEDEVVPKDAILWNVCSRCSSAVPRGAEGPAPLPR